MLSLSPFSHRFGCQLCDHEATTKSNLLRHMHKKHNQPARGLKQANTSILDSNGYDSTVVYDNALSNDKASNGNESSQNETATHNSSEVEPVNFYMESVMEWKYPTTSITSDLSLKIRLASRNQLGLSKFYTLILIKLILNFCTLVVLVLCPQ